MPKLDSRKSEKEFYLDTAVIKHANEVEIVQIHLRFNWQPDSLRSDRVSVRIKQISYLEVGT